MSAIKDYPGLFVGGQWRAPTTDAFEPVVNPATEVTLAMAPVGGLGDLDAALVAARSAFDSGPWPRMDPTARAGFLTEFLAGLRDRRADLVELVIAETGAIGSLAKRLHVDQALDHFEWVIEAATRRPRIAPVTATAGGSQRAAAGLIVRDPVGVVAAITPFNFPFFLNIEKLAPALAMGNTVVLKSAPQTPLEALVLGEVAEAVGLPAGVLNVITGGAEVGTALTSDPRVDLITFTGSDVVGAQVMAQAARNLTPVLLELGGKSAMIVRSDADLDAAVPFGLAQFTIQAGQGCALCTRHIVQRDVAEEYTESLISFAGLVTIGDPAVRGTMMGPLISAAQRERVERHIESGVREGASLRFGGCRPPGLAKGWFLTPTIFSDVDNRSAIAQTEIFGPVVSIIVVDGDEEAVRVANDSAYGLGGSVFSRDTSAALALALQVRTGYVTVNGGGGSMSPELPFGGVKRSGMGRELGQLGLDAFTEVKSIDVGL